MNEIMLNNLQKCNWFN